MDIDELSRRIDKYHEEDRKRNKKSSTMNLSYTLWAFTLATIGIFLANKDWTIAIIAVIFLICGFISLGFSAKIKIE